MGRALPDVCVASAYQVLYPHNPLQDSLCVGVVGLVVHNPRAINEEDLLHERDVLPHLCLSWHRRHFADLQGTGRRSHKASSAVNRVCRCAADGSSILEHVPRLWRAWSEEPRNIQYCSFESIRRSRSSGTCISSCAGVCCKKTRATFCVKCTMNLHQRTRAWPPIWVQQDR